MVDLVLERIQKRFPPPIALSQHPPLLPVEAIMPRIHSILSTGRFMDHEELLQLQKTLCSKIGMSYCVLTNSGTSALHLALRLLNVNPGDEVLVPALTYVAPVNVVLYQGAVPHLYDLQVETLQVDVEKLACSFQILIEKTSAGPVNKITQRPIKACIVVHTVGFPAPVREVVELCHAYQIPVVEDIAEALGSYYYGQHVGTFGDIACLSFNVNKVVTGGGGGALMVKREQEYHQALLLAQVGKTPHPWRYLHHKIGYNYMMNAIQAAIINPQLEQLEQLLEKKRRIHSIYQKLFEDIEGVYLLKPIEGGAPNYWLNCLAVSSLWQEELLKRAHELKIDIRSVWTPVHHMRPYRERSFFRDLNGVDEAARRYVLLPSGYNLLEAGDGVV